MTQRGRPLLIFGTGELAQLAHFFFCHDDRRQVAAFVVDAAYRQAAEFMGLPLVASEGLETRFPPTDFEMFVAIGYTQLNRVREARCIEARQRGYTLASYISSRASTWPDLKFGDNCLVMEGNVIQPFVSLGDGVIMFASSVLSHHVSVGDYCFIGSEVTLSGGVRVGARSFVGVNATVKDHVEIGADCLIGAGTLILKDAAPGSGYIEAGSADSGIPSRRLRSLL